MVVVTIFETRADVFGFLALLWLVPVVIAGGLSFLFQLATSKRYRVAVMTTSIFGAVWFLVIVVILLWGAK